MGTDRSRDDEQGPMGHWFYDGKQFGLQLVLPGFAGTGQLVGWRDSEVPEADGGEAGPPAEIVPADVPQREGGPDEVGSHSKA